ncbi:hypothetical protein FACS1894113_3500 [Alphaproteobacteria bacterium]|nr:hypothetical protein FACS1894113_3500 [Alphaproteobacteria bacterium]
MNTIIEKSEFRALDLAVLKCHLRLESNLEDEYLSRIIDMATETFENETGKSILKKKYRYVCNDYSSKICLPMQPVLKVCSVTNNRNTKAEPSVEVEYIAGICDDPEKVPKDIQLAILQMAKSIYDGNDIAINSYKTLSIS